MKNKEYQEWDIPKFIYDNWKDVSFDFISIAFQQAEKLLNETVKSGEGITQKALKVLGFAVSILTIALGYAVSNNPNTILFIAAILTIILCIISIIFLIKPIWTYQTYVSGSRPSMTLNKEEMITGFKEETGRNKNMLLNECAEYEKRIRYNLKLNMNRSDNVDYAMILLVFVPFTLILSWFITTFTNFCPF